MNVIDIITPIIEIGVIAFIINYFLSFFWNTRSMDLLVGLLALFAMFAISSILHLPILYSIMTNLMNVAAVGLIMIFQPELRVALSRLSLKGKRYQEVTEFDKFISQLTDSVYRLASRRIGALIALEHMDKLDEYAQNGVVLNANFSSELLESIFAASTPLHDGAVIIRDMTIVSASAILPLADGSLEVSRSSFEISRAMGTRHLAALGLSQRSDALLIVISEDTGKVSLAREGVMSKGVRIHQFTGVIHSIYNNSNPKPHQKKFLFRDWMRSKMGV